MRIIFVVSGLLYGGAETQVIALARCLSSKGHAVAIYTLNNRVPRLAELQGSGVEVTVDQKKTTVDPFVLRRLRRFIKTFQADLVQGFLYDGDLYSRLACAGMHVPVFSSERSDQYHLSLGQRIGYRLTHRLAAGVIANSNAGARFAQKRYGFSKDRVHVVWNGIDLSTVDKRIEACTLDYKSMFFGDGKFKVACFVGNIKPAKDYMLALEVANILTKYHPEWRTLFLGDQLSNTGTYKMKVRAFYEEAGLEGRAHFGGLRQDIIEILSQCDVFFSTSVHEGFPNVVLEAMAVGVPVVSTDYSDIKLILPRDWQVVPDRRSEALAEAIVEASDSRETLAAEQRAWVENNAKVEGVTSRLEAVYRKQIGLEEREIETSF